MSSVEVLKLLHDFARRHNITCPEGVHQNDNVLIEAPKLIEDLLWWADVFTEEEDEDEYSD